jgi:GNAT superfamily N-acetyltransferase
MSAVIRAAEAGDVEAVLHMQRRLAAAHVEWDAHRFEVSGETEPAYRAWLTKAREGSHKSSGVMALVAVVDGVVSGYMIAELMPREPKYWATACVYIHDLYLETAARGRGVAEAFLERARGWALEEGVGMRAMVASSNSAGRAFFERTGFRSASVEMNWQAD